MRVIAVAVIEKIRPFWCNLSNPSDVLVLLTCITFVFVFPACFFYLCFVVAGYCGSWTGKLASERCALLIRLSKSALVARLEVLLL